MFSGQCSCVESSLTDSNINIQRELEIALPRSLGLHTIYTMFSSTHYYEPYTQPTTMTSRNANMNPAILLSQLKNNKWFSARILEKIVDKAPFDSENGRVICGSVDDDEYLAYVFPNDDYTGASTV